MHRGEGALCYLAQTLFYGGHSWEGGHSKQCYVFGGQEENVSNKENCPGPPMTL